MKMCDSLDGIWNLDPKRARHPTLHVAPPESRQQSHGSAPKATTLPIDLKRPTRDPFPTMPSPALSKTSYLAGLQCTKLLWHLKNSPESFAPGDDEPDPLAEQGRQVGILARALYPGGTEIPWDSPVEERLRLTRQAIATRVPVSRALSGPRSRGVGGTGGGDRGGDLGGDAGGFGGQAGAAGGGLSAWSCRPGLSDRGTVDRICWMVRLPASPPSTGD